MDKKSFLKIFRDEEEAEVLNLYNKFKLAKDKDLTMFSSEFYTPNIWKKLCDISKIDGVIVENDGIFDESERRIISFNNEYNYDYPIRILKIRNKSKFKNLVHKDYLGAILSLGINRNKLGDLLVKDDACFVAVFEEIGDYLISNLHKINNVTCEVLEVLKDDLDINYTFKEDVINISGLRIDSIVSKLINKSRSNAQDEILGGRVLVNYVVIRDKSYEIKEDDRVTIRGNGKYIIGNVVGNTKSGKKKVIIKKYT